jgi:hypothetical protein
MGVCVTVGLADALGVTVTVRVIVGLADALGVVVAVVGGVIVGVCASAVHKPSVAKRRGPPTDKRNLFARRRFSAHAKPFATIMIPPVASTRSKAVGQ